MWPKNLEKGINRSLSAKKDTHTVHDALTFFLRNFREKKITTYNGLEMFLYQGQKSFYLWNKINPTIDEELKKLIIFNLK